MDNLLQDLQRSEYLLSKESLQIALHERILRIQDQIPVYFPLRASQIYIF